MSILHFQSVMSATTNTTPTYSLSGTAGSPNNRTDSQTFPDDATAGWIFHQEGYVQQFPGGSFNEGTEWTDEYPPGPAIDSWLRATLQSGGDALDGNSDSTGSWIKLGNGADRRYTWTETGVGTTTGTVYIEISTNSSGTEIVATGYYKGTATVSV